MESFEFYFYDSQYESYRDYCLEIEDIYQIYFRDVKWNMLNRTNKIWLLCYIKYLCVDFNKKQLIQIHNIPNNVNIEDNIEYNNF